MISISKSSSTIPQYTKLEEKIDSMLRASPRTGGCNLAVGFAQGGRASGAAGADGENGMLSCQECHCEIHFSLWSLQFKPLVMVSAVQAVGHPAPVVLLKAVFLYVSFLVPWLPYAAMA